MPGLREYTEKDWLESLNEGRPVYNLPKDDTLIDIGSISRRERPAKLLEIGIETISLRKLAEKIEVFDEGQWILLSSYRYPEVLLDAYPRVIGSEQAILLSESKEFLINDFKLRTLGYLKDRLQNCINQINTNQGHYKIHGNSYLQYDTSRRVCYFSQKDHKSVKFDFIRAFQYIIDYIIVIKKPRFFRYSEVPSIDKKLKELIPDLFSEEECKQIIYLYNRLLEIYYEGFSLFYSEDNDRRKQGEIIEYSVEDLSAVINRSKDALNLMMQRAQINLVIRN